MAPGEPVKLLDRTRSDPETNIDETDRKILSFCSQNTHLPLERVADNSGVTESTVRHRLQALEARKVILAIPYYLNAEKLGIHTFRILICMKGLQHSINDQLFILTKDHPAASQFVHCLGSWDLELTFEVDTSSLIGEIVEQVNDQFAPKIREMHNLSEVYVHRAHHFPLAAGIA